MVFALGMVAGSVLSFVIWVAYFGPKHWEWYREREDLKKALHKALERGEHYKQLTKPTEWGPVDQHEARIVKKPKLFPVTPAVKGDKSDVAFKFDDIRETP